MDKKKISLDLLINNNHLDILLNSRYLATIYPYRERLSEREREGERERERRAFSCS